MKKEAGILFDYNGVIVNDEHLHEEAMMRTVGEYKFSLSHAAYQRYCQGRSDLGAFSNLQHHFPDLKSLNVATLIEKKARVYMDIIQHQSILFPGVINVIEKLHEHFSLAIVTGSLKIEIGPVVAQENIAHLFKAIITADDITHSKPDPEGYQKGIAALELPAEKIVVIEDTPVGINAAKAAGLLCIAVCHTVDATQLQHADHIVESATHITPDVVWSMIATSTGGR